MNLPNSNFLNFPIEYKEINLSDFPEFITAEKIEITPSNGYIRDAVMENIDSELSNTLVINSGVGSGKTTAIVSLVKQFVEQDYLVIVASPFISLVEQYYKDICGEISIDNVYRYDWLDNSEIDYLTRQVQIVTINALLGNPGENSILNSEQKRIYFNRLINSCQNSNTKVVVIYDEIHDAIHNFKQEYIFNLWKWKDILHKNIILSATYNEASKIVIEYLAELTEDRIKILEAKRNRQPENRLSNLHLYYDHSINYTNQTGTLIKVVSDVIESGKGIDIICFSKKLAESIYDKKTKGVGKLLYDKYGSEINLCISAKGIDEPVRYSNDVCNIGTNFKTGVSIKKENHALVLILPHRSAKSSFESLYGIFSSGIISIIQAIARKRTKGDIYIIMPKPSKFNYESLPFTDNEQKASYYNWYKVIENHRSNDKITYHRLAIQNDILETYYTQIYRENSLDVITRIQDTPRSNRLPLSFPTFKEFKLKHGENYLASKVLFWGKDLSSYVTYSSFTNQFVNCNLTYINSKPPIYFKEGCIQRDLEAFYKNYFDNNYIDSLRQQSSDKYIYYEILKELYQNYKIIYKPSGEDTTYNQIDKFEVPNFEQQLFVFIQRKLFPNNDAFNSNYQGRYGVVDYPFTRSDYFRFCIANALVMNENNDELDDTTKELIIAFKSMEYFRLKLVENIRTVIKNNEEIKYLPNHPFDEFITKEEMVQFAFLINTLKKKDDFIANKLFTFNTSGNMEANIKTLYSYFLKDFFVAESDRIYENSREQRVKKILDIKPIPQARQTLNFIDNRVHFKPFNNLQPLDVLLGFSLEEE